LDIDLRKLDADLRILKKGHRSDVQDVCDVEIEHGFENWTSIRDWTSI
jgi:hypothetical protein